MDWPIPDELIYRPPSIPGPRVGVGEVLPGLHQRSLGVTSAFIVITPDAESGEASVTVIDSGWRRFHNRPLLSYLGGLGYGADSVERLISTHYHPDHVGGMAGLRRATGAPVSAHWLEAPYLAGKPGKVIPNPVEPRWLRPLMWPLMAPMTPPHFPVATELDDGDCLPLLGGARVVHTPGHTPGSISLHFPNEGALLVADAIQRYQGRLTLPSRWFTSDMEAAKRSVQKLASLDFEILCFSHFEPMRKGARAALRSLAEYVS
ncbi:MAG: MBL fold metallo-hydrolase [Chloroflexi bacterium]|nr:MBL fold metallo-hydrolase [Chloroflexota bacterium]